MLLRGIWSKWRGRTKMAVGQGWKRKGGCRLKQGAPPPKASRAQGPGPGAWSLRPAACWPWGNIQVHTAHLNLEASTQESRQLSALFSLWAQIGPTEPPDFRLFMMKIIGPAAGLESGLPDSRTTKELGNSGGTRGKPQTGAIHKQAPSFWLLPGLLDSTSDAVKERTRHLRPIHFRPGQLSLRLAV